MVACASSRCPSELGLSSGSDVKLELVEEGSEPTEFIKALGTQEKKAYDCMLKGSSSLSPTDPSQSRLIQVHSHLLVSTRFAENI